MENNNLSTEAMNLAQQFVSETNPNPTPKDYIIAHILIMKGVQLAENNRMLIKHIENETIPLIGWHRWSGE